MWVNISDSLLSVILVWLLIPRMGIMGYAVVIVIMEGYNFLLSFMRLRKRISFKITPIRSFILPLASATVGAYLSRLIFNFAGSSVSPIWLVTKMVFALCITVIPLALFNARSEFKREKILKGKIKTAAE